MPFGFKNAGATFQRLVDQIFKEKIEEMMEVDVDDMVVKGKEKKDLFTHLQVSFDLLHKYIIKLKSEKCTFGVALAEFLSYLVTNCGIETNSFEIRVTIEMKFIRIVKETKA